MYTAVLISMNFIRDTKLSNFIFPIIYALAIFFLSKLLLKAGGYQSEKLIIIALSIITAILTSSKTRFCIFLPFLVIITLYAPIGFEYGKPKYQYFSSFFATNFNESIEFFQTIEITCYLKALTIPLLGFLTFFISKKYKIDPLKNKLFSTASILFMFFCSGVFPFIKDALAAFTETKNEISKILIDAKKK
ncbi:MAG: hypothetical protein ACRC9R_08380 [Enterovibrio sp.]